jgi:parvulin-like peptidyl-prolyl isomerase
MESLRNFLTGPRLLIVVLVCALPFVFLGTGSLGSTFGGSFGTINGEDVTENDIALASSSAVQRFKSVYGEDFDFDMLDEDFKSETIKQELILQKVLQAGAKSLGFINESTRNKTKKRIIQSPIFQIDGQFSEGVYEAQVNSNGYTKEGYIDVMTIFAASDIYRSSFNTINFVTDNELLELVTLFEKSSDINFIKISFDELKSEIVNSSKELLDYYNENQILFFSEEERSFKYISLLQSSYKDSVEIPDSYLENAYSQYLNRFDDSAQIRISHIMIDKINYDSRDLAFESIKNIENILIDGNDFASVANEYSEDVVTKDIGGDLEYFEKDIFPPQFDEAIQDLDLNDISEIVELDDTFHILKITEKNIEKPLSEDQVKDDLINELIETESFALMQDDFDESENMIMQNNTIEEIAESLTKNINNSDMYTKTNYDFQLADFEIKDYLFSSEAMIGQPYTIELADRILIISIDNINEPKLQPYENVAEEVSVLLSEAKAIEKIALLTNEVNSISNEDEKSEFIGAYSYVTDESFVDVKRYSSLLPREVLSSVFNSKSGARIQSESNNKDKYIIDIIQFNAPLESDIEQVLNEYSSFGEDVISTKMSQIINEDVFDSARVNLSNLIF